MPNKAKRSFCINHFSILLQRLVKANKISSQSAERAKAQYSSFFDVVDSNVTAFTNLTRKMILVEIRAMPICMWEVCKTIITLSHGQSSVEQI